ncbi:hypothetical protein AAU61_10215 [Desulfocarbo indianensis]|nr:hypothetical protein AAU61_10215 [Desulfocarbo indianensis]
MSSRTAIQLCCLLLAWCGMSWAHWHWLGLNLQPFSYDQAHHLLLALDYQPVLVSPARWLDILTVAIYYPPLYHCSLALWLFIAGPEMQMAALVNLFWLLALMLGTWLIGRRSVGGWAGAAAAALLALLPVCAGLTRDVLVEISLAATVVWSVYALLMSENYSRPHWVLALGALAGLGMLAKWSFVLYLALPMAWAWWQGGRQGVARHRKSLWQALLIFLALTLPWYLHTPRTLIKGMLGNLGPVPAAEGDPSVFSLGSLLYYPISLVNDQIFLPLALLLAGGLVWGLIRGRAESKPLLVWLLGGWAVLILLSNKDMRYLFPLLPAACLLSMGWLASLKPRALAAGLSACALGLAFLVSWGSGFAWGPLARDYGLAYPGGVLRVCGLDTEYSRPPVRADWQVPAILQAVKQDWRESDRTPVLGVMASMRFFHKSGFLAWARLRGLPVTTRSCLEPQCWPPGRPKEGLRRDLSRLDYLVTKTGGLGLEPAYGRACRMMEDMGADLGVRLIDYPLPDGGRAILWRLKRADRQTAVKSGKPGQS